MATAVPPPPPSGGAHDHGFDVPVVVGPMALDLLLTVGIVLAVAAIGLRPFLDARDEAPVARVATLGTAAAGVSLLLTAGPAEGMPTGGLAALGVAGLVIPFAAVRRDRPRLRRAAARVAPVAIAVAGVAALTATTTAALFAAAVALAWAAVLRAGPGRVLPAVAACGAVVVPGLLLGVTT
ncbi:DUF6239 family natural product biosynthesis protein [Actinomycetospora aeridis]|uniref:DUF6239 family natural product biosynthesis protein n=1 Tax=Actinomycetospora aeridis TaxID=3129231 RepID=A0ABU8N0A6_9PSEU